MATPSGNLTPWYVTVWLLFKIDLIFAAEPTAGTDTNTAAAVASNTNFFIVLLNDTCS